MASAIPTTDVVCQGKPFLDVVWGNCHEFFDKEKHIDVTFLWRSYPKRVTAHRLILAAASDYFDKLFQTKNGSAPVIYMESIPPDEFELLIAYCYTGKLNPKMSSVSRLLNGATILKLDGAAAICTAYLQGQTVGSRERSETACQSTAYHPWTANTTNKSILAVRRCTEKGDTESSLYRCDEMEKIWIQCGVLKFPNLSSNLVYTNKHLISLGGFSDNGLPVNDVYSYSLATQVWKKLQHMSVARAGLCVENIDDTIYAIGGFSTNNGVAIRSAEKLDPSTGEWTPLPNMHCARSYATAVAGDHHKIYVIGGSGSDKTLLKSVECFNTITGKWHKCANMISARIDCGASFFKGILYVIGSGNATPFSNSSVECYNPRTDTWSQVAPLNVARHGICGITLSNRLMALGGGTDFKGVVEVYKPTQNSWLQVKPLPRNGYYRCFVVPTKELVEICGKPQSEANAPQIL